MYLSCLYLFFIVTIFFLECDKYVTRISVPAERRIKQRYGVSK
jgi:hypothetical protein